MDAVPPPEEELAALRRRAYGPDADIVGDPRAQARLADLEYELAVRPAGDPGRLSRRTRSGALSPRPSVFALEDMQRILREALQPNPDRV